MVSLISNREELVSLIEKRLPEGQRLEFKRMSLRDGSLDKDSVRDICQTVSAFANSGGGALICGVDTIKDSGLDVASELVPIPDARRIRDLCQATLFNCITPSVTGLTMDVIETGVDGEGAIVILVPDSDDRPHMSAATNDHRYYKRNGHQTLRMSDIDVRDQILRKKAGSVQAKIEIRSAMLAGKRKQFSCRFILSNNSSVSGENIYLHLLQTSQLHPNPRAPDYGFQKTWAASNQPVFLADPGILLHPGMQIIVTELNFVLSRESGSIKFYPNLSPDEPGITPEISASFRFGCKDSQASTRSFRLAREGIDDLFDSGQKLSLIFANSENETPETVWGN